jgi:hypothetical protein
MLAFVKQFGPLTPSYYEPREIREQIPVGRSEPEWVSRTRLQEEDNEWQYEFSMPLLSVRAIWETAATNREGGFLLALDLFHSAPAGSLLYLIAGQSLEHLLHGRIIRPCAGCSRWFHTREDPRGARRQRSPRSDSVYHSRTCERAYHARQHRLRLKGSREARKENDG